MILTGRIDDRNRLWAQVSVAGLTTDCSISALIDTGFTGDLLLPLRVAIPLGLPLIAVAQCELADGSVINQMLFRATITWGTKSQTATIHVADVDEALIGGGLLHGYVLNVDFQKKTLTIKEPGTDEPQQNAGVAQ